MQYDVRTPEEYLSVLADDWRRERLLELREIILECGPHLKEGIEYKMLSYRDERGGVFALNAQKHYVALYVGDAQKVDPDGTLLAGLDVGKGCIRFTKSKAVSATRIREFIQRAISIRQRGGDIDC
ncbi:MAG: hypothetical protein BAA04_00175 [Firmicutes bacterium ZCTH02-B6]|nr:MAG: hypothetical protein BAA04_00175 [Firmicutes bacterium ZCTH02-B6]